MRSSLLVKPSCLVGIGRSDLVRSFSLRTSTDISPVLVLMTGPLACTKSPVSSSGSSFIPTWLSAAFNGSTVSALRNSCTCPLMSLSTINPSLPNFRIPAIRPTTVTSLFSSSSNLPVTSASVWVRLLFAGYGSTPSARSSSNLRNLSSRSSLSVAIIC